MSIVGGDETTMPNNLLIKLSGMARSWYLVLAPGWVYSWEQLRQQLHANFYGNKTKEVTTAKLYALVQGPYLSIPEVLHRHIVLDPQLHQRECVLRRATVNL